MKNYLDLCRDILENGTRQANRTGTDAISLPGAMMKFDLAQGFPLMTTKKLAVKGMIGELCAFLEGATSAARFRELGCEFWNKNANENNVTPDGRVVPNAWLKNPNRQGTDDLGRIYGAQWRHWRGEQMAPGMFIEHDQVAQAIGEIKFNPTNRRIIINAWRPDEFDQMALPPCHVLYQFLCNVEKKELHLCMYQRSCDMFLGVPMNIASASLFLSIMAHLTGYKPGTFTHFLADAHIYVNHIDQVKEQMSREPLPLPRLIISDALANIDRVYPEFFSFQGYQHHPAIKGEMAV